LAVQRTKQKRPQPAFVRLRHVEAILVNQLEEEAWFQILRIVL
jgi:hypothetical protein